MERRIIVDATKFKCVKILLESGANYAEITQMTWIGDVTIWRIKNAETFEEYRHNVQAAAISAKQKKRMREEAAKKLDEEVKKQEAVKAQEAEDKRKEEDRRQEKPYTMMASNYQTNRLIELLREQNEILKCMSNKLAFIVDELTMPVKKGGE